MVGRRKVEIFDDLGSNDEELRMAPFYEEEKLTFYHSDLHLRRTSLLFSILDFYLRDLSSSFGVLSLSSLFLFLLSSSVLSLLLLAQLRVPSSTELTHFCSLLLHSISQPPALLASNSAPSRLTLPLPRSTSLRFALSLPLPRFRPQPPTASLFHVVTLSLPQQPPALIP